MVLFNMAMSHLGFFRSLNNWLHVDYAAAQFLESIFGNATVIGRLIHFLDLSNAAVIRVL